MDEEEEKKDGQEQTEQTEQTEQATPNEADDGKGVDARMSDIVEKLRKQYEEREAAQKEAYEKALKERDDTIQALLFGDGTESSEADDEVIKRIRAARGTFKKW